MQLEFQAGFGGVSGAAEAFQARPPSAPGGAEALGMRRVGHKREMSVRGFLWESVGGCGLLGDNRTWERLSGESLLGSVDTVAAETHLTFWNGRLGEPCVI